MTDTSSIDHFADLFAEYAGPIPGRPDKSPVIVEPCDGCRGTGRWTGTYGYGVSRPCFKCKGTGKREFKTTALQRQASRDYSEKRRQQQSALKADKVAAWREANPAEAKWIDRNASGFEFAGAMQEALNKWGGLTDGQLNGVRKCLLREEERATKRVSETAARQAAAPTVSIAAIETAFQHAMGKGIKRPKMRLADFKFSLAGSNSVNQGAIYVNQGYDYLGKIMGGKFIRARECTDETEQKIVMVCTDPKEAAIAYGRRTGSCAICARELTKHASIELGIGPICAEKYGW